MNNNSENQGILVKIKKDEELVLLRDMLDLLQPEDADDSRKVDKLLNEISWRSAPIELTFSIDEVMLSIGALEICSSDDPEIKEMAERMEYRFRGIYEDYQKKISGDQDMNELVS